MARVGIPTEILIAVDAFKGTFTAPEVAGAIGRGLAQAGWASDALPLADGGEGTLEVLAGPLDLELVEIEVADPLGRPVTAAFGLSRDQAVAVVEMARASGLALVTEADRDSVAASSAGTGELIAAAAAAGAKSVLVTVGGSATSDGGAGALCAIDRCGGLQAAELTVLCDVRTPFEDAAVVFGPQKGASPDGVRVLSERLDRLAAEWARDGRPDPRGVPMTGAAGGLAGGLWAAHNAKLVSGAGFVLDALGFDARMRAARAVVTGEGRLDRQSLVGKLVGEVATRCRQAGVPCHAIVGRRDLDRFDQRILDLQVVLEAPDSLKALQDAGERLAGLV